MFVSAPETHASDAGLRELVADVARAEKRLERRFEAVPERTGGQQSLGRYLRRRAAVARFAVRGHRSLRTRIAREAPETAETTAARDLVLRGLRDESTAYGRYDTAARAFARAAIAATSQAAYDRALGRFQRQERATIRLGERGERLIAEGSTRIAQPPAPPPL